MKTTVKHLLVLVLVLYFGPACAIPAPSPPPGLNTIIDGMEYFMELGPSITLGNRLEDYITNVNLSFGQADAIAFLWIPITTNLSGGFWPDVDDPYNGQFNRQTYIDFARTHRNQGGNSNPFGTFFITGPSMANTQCDVPHTLGMSTGIPGFPNSIPTDARDRFTYVFVDRVEQLHNFSGCFRRPGSQQNYPKDNVYVHLITHEVGHQRAGLTHADDPANQNYHQGFDPPANSGRLDVMISNLYSPNLDNSWGMFDQFPFPSSATNSCANNLHRLRVVNP
jgi:hypothetical protein